MAVSSRCRGKAERVENVKSVILINYVLFNLKSKFSRRFTDRLTWPGIIELTDRTFNPILDWQEVSTRKSMGNELGQAPKRLILDDAIRPRLSAVDSHGNVVVGECGKCNINVIQRTGETKVVHELPDCGEGKVIEQGIVGLAVDKNNNVYIVRWVKTHTENCDVECYVLNVLDENYNVKHRCRFDFLQVAITIPYVTSPYFHVVWITIHTNNNMIMIKNGDSNVYVCDNVGQLKHKFEPHSVGIPWLGISNKDEIMIPSHDGTAVHFHSEEGNLKSTIELPEGHEVLGVAFHYVICKIIVLTYVMGKDSYFLVCYTETGELETSTLFSEDDDIKWSPSINSHPSGPVAVVREKTITFI